MKCVVLAAAAGLAAASGVARAQSYTESVLFSFGGKVDGGNPQSVLIMDGAGNLYGTTASGGGHAMGTVFELSPTGTETVLYAFRGGADGAAPTAGLVGDAAGNLYGTTSKGGSAGFGTVFEISNTGVETILHSFAGGTDGAFPTGSLARDGAGNLYGTTLDGGIDNDGVVYELPVGAAETILHAFTGQKDGSFPEGGVIYGAGKLYGTSSAGAKTPDGQVFGLGVNGTYGTLAKFDGADGELPFGGLLEDSAGNFYGTTEEGGTAGAGVVYKLTKAGKQTVLYAFSGGADGKTPDCTLVQNARGVVYGTTIDGGANGLGTVFAVTPNGTQTVLYSFAGGAGDGAYPQAGLLMDAQGNLYGTTNNGGPKGAGTVYKLTVSK